MEEGFIFWGYRAKHWKGIILDNNEDKKKVYVLSREVYTKDKKELKKICFHWCFWIRRGGTSFGLVGRRIVSGERMSKNQSNYKNLTMNC